MTGTPTYLPSRLFAGAGALLFTAVAVRSVFDLLTSEGADLLFFGFFSVIIGMAAAMCWWFVLRGHLAESRAVMGAGCLSGLIVGGVAFLAGFIGPILLAPDANQGPLLGIFFTGPLGFVVGTAGGVIVAKLRRRKGQSDGDGGHLPSAWPRTEVDEP